LGVFRDGEIERGRLLMARGGEVEFLYREEEKGEEKGFLSINFE
jgi:hypothetical protein